MPYFEFPEGLTLGNSRDSRSVKVYALGKGPAGALEYNMENWGNGSQVTTSLINPAGEVCSSLLKFKTKTKLIGQKFDSEIYTHRITDIFHHRAFL